MIAIGLAVAGKMLSRQTYWAAKHLEFELSASLFCIAYDFLCHSTGSRADTLLRYLPIFWTLKRRSIQWSAFAIRRANQCGRRL
jgi:hypothetical protein